jgi:hypothetical protein
MVGHERLVAQRPQHGHQQPEAARAAAAAAAKGADVRPLGSTGERSSVRGASTPRLLPRPHRSIASTSQNQRSFSVRLRHALREDCVVCSACCVCRCLVQRARLCNSTLQPHSTTTAAPAHHTRSPSASRNCS